MSEHKEVKNAKHVSVISSDDVVVSHCRGVHVVGCTNVQLSGCAEVERDEPWSSYIFREAPEESDIPGLIRGWRDRVEAAIRQIEEVSSAYRSRGGE